MAYKALYRKYRPATFAEVVGQQSIIATLTNEIKNDKLAHAYLFCGPRGTGKTTVAKLLAKAINCQSEGERPCGHCPSCLDIQESAHPDVIELDAASNNGVDEVREIIERVKFAPLNGKYKVYIIDEVHMMTPSAFNALLKTLEEPPSYCVFVLATTEPHKVLPTIVSRCQRFDFRKIDSRVIAGKIAEICRREEIECDQEAANLIAELAEGGMRDALSILDQTIAYAGRKVTAEDVEMVYGVASLGDKLDLFDCVRNKDAVKLVDKVNEISSRGLDIQRLTADLINIAKDCVIYAYGHDQRTLAALSRDKADEMLKKFRTDELLKYIDYLIDAQKSYRDTGSALTYFEVSLLKMMDFQPEEPLKTAKTPKNAERNENAAEKQPETAPALPEMKPERPATAAKEYAEYSDEEYYDILTKANKSIKSVDRTFVDSLEESQLPSEMTELIKILKASEIMAASRENIIFVAKDRVTANRINEISAKQALESALAGFLTNRKAIIAVTPDQKQFLIDYFKARRNNPQPVTEIKTAETAEITPEEPASTDKLDELFGKNGYDIIGE